MQVTACNYSNLSTPSLCLRMRRLELISSLSTKVLSSQRTVSSEPEMVNPFRPCKTRVLSKLTVSPAKCDIETEGTKYIRGVIRFQVSFKCGWPIRDNRRQLLVARIKFKWCRSDKISEISLLNGISHLNRD